MSQFGFVYILGNEHMPDLIKIGCTERSPRARADELSKATGVPAPFRVLCYAEFDDFQAVERNMHSWCADKRVNSGREFFKDCLKYAVSLLYHHPRRLSFSDSTDDGVYNSELTEMVCTEGHESHFGNLRNPFAKREAEDERIAKLKRWAEGDFEDAVNPIDVVPELGGPAQAAGPEEPSLRIVGGTEA